MSEKTIWRNNLQITFSPYQIQNDNNRKTVNFSGYLGNESVKVMGEYVRLRHETAFLRELETLEYIKQYLLENFPEIPVKNILIGACSTGEEALSMKMVMNKVPSRITAFDLGKKAINRAKKGYYSISEPRYEDDKKYVEEWGLSAYNDKFLAFKKPQDMTQKEKTYHKAFNKIFKEINTEDGKNKFLNRIRVFFKSFGEFHMIDVRTKYFKLKDLRKLNCEYIEGDIRNLDEITKGRKYQAFTFRNAFYHLITTNDDYRTPLGEHHTRKILAEILPKINKSLDMKGLFAIGKKEDEQICDVLLLTKMLKEYGFKEAKHFDNPYCYIWKKVKEC
ncbi:MAG: CheR family methyltransferase [Candidatus Gastranaerophilaceae bacterium]|nr:CheR family methyltransferase [Candidatus Gastranaerophilaceae bacterium]